MTLAAITNNNFRILHTEWSSGWGGQEQRIILECRKLMELGHTVILACQPDSGIMTKAREQGIPVEEVIIRRSWDIKAIFHLCKLIKKYHIDIVNTHSGKDTWAGGIAAKLSGAFFIRTRHLSITLSNSPFNFIHRLADGTITTGVAIRETMIAHNKIAPERIVSIATGVNVDRFNPDRVVKDDVLMQEFGIPADCPVVTMVAVLRSMKRYDIFIETARILNNRFPDARFIIVGDGPGRDWVEGLVRDAGLSGRIILTGYRQDVQNILALSDVVVLTSDRFEGVPQSLSQAMAMGRAVVASPIGSIPELIEDGVTGCFAETGNPDSFAEKIRQLLEDQNLRKKLGTKARAHILEQYTDDIMARSTLSFYSRITGRH